VVVTVLLLLIIISLTRIGRRQPDHVYDRQPVRRNSGETLAIYAASRINQLRKSSSAASQLRKINKINYLRGWQ
jgi:hypothetical protein